MIKLKIQTYMEDDQTIRKMILGGGCLLILIIIAVIVFILLDLKYGHTMG